MTLLQVLRGVVRDPDLAVPIFRDQYFEREVDRDGGGSLHQGRSTSRIAEDGQLGRRHLQTYLGRLTAMVHQDEQSDGLGRKRRLETLNSFVY